jgi:hypothetical protein
MKWKGRRESTNVVDSRGKKVVGTAGAGMLLNFVGRRFGIKGILIMFAVVGVLWMTGLVDPNTFLGGQTSTQSAMMRSRAAPGARSFRTALPTGRRSSGCVGLTRATRAGVLRMGIRSRCLTMLCDRDFTVGADLSANFAVHKFADKSAPTIQIFGYRFRCLLDQIAVPQIAHRRPGLPATLWNT